MKESYLLRLGLLCAAILLLAALTSLATLVAAAAPPPGAPLNVKYLLTVTVSGPGQATGGGAYSAGSVATLDPKPDAGALFVGWTIDGTFAGWANPRQLTMDAPHEVVAHFASYSVFPDLPPNNLGRDVIGELAARGIIQGYADGTFGPADPILRAQMAALIARSVPGDSQSGPGIGPQTWAQEDHGTGFPDRGSVDADLWRAVGALAHYEVAKGYPDGTYDPTGEVLKAQAISFIARAMVAKGYWVQQADDPALYPNVPAGSGHRQDIATYVHYAGALPEFSDVTAPFATWDRPATRAWFAGALWQAYDSYFATIDLP